MKIPIRVKPFIDKGITHYYQAWTMLDGDDCRGIGTTEELAIEDLKKRLRAEMKSETTKWMEIEI